MKQEITLQDFAEICCDRMYNPELPESDQCSGWYALKKMVLEDIPPEGNLVNAFHPTLRNLLTKHWDKIKALPIK